jgi:hypothetical protein
LTVSATASKVTDQLERRHIFDEILRQAGRTDDVDQWVESSPLIEFRVLDAPEQGTDKRSIEGEVGEVGTSDRSHLALLLSKR